MNIQDVKNMISSRSEMCKSIKHLPEEEFRSFIKDAINDFLASSDDVKNEQILYVGLLGWTPGFNDGDPCTHSYDLSVVTREFVIRRLSDRLDDVDPNSLNEKTNEEIQQLVEEIDMAESILIEWHERGPSGSVELEELLNFLLECRFETNFKMIATIRDNTVVSMIYDNEYYCGY